jgi:hypothetical protein
LTQQALVRRRQAFWNPNLGIDGDQLILSTVDEALKKAERINCQIREGAQNGNGQ